jgi:glycosyltransferase involved in cell wall biosynthesis
MRFAPTRRLVGTHGGTRTAHYPPPEMGSASGNDGGTALVIVRNPCTHDSRVLREARLLRRMGYSPLILGVVSDVETATTASVDGMPIRRLEPTSPLAWLRSKLRRGSGSAPGASAEPAGVAADLAVTARPQPASPLVRLHRWLRTLDFYRRAIRVVLKERPALIHCNDYNTMWVGVAARTLTGAAVVYDAHELWPDRNLRPEPRWWLLACEALFVRRAHRTITASPGYADVIAKRYRVPRPPVVRNIPELPATEAGVSVGNGDGAEGDGAVTYIGALTRNRGLEDSIRAIALVPHARLRMVGPIHPPYRAELESLAEREGVSDRFELAGPVPPGEAVESIRGAAVGLALIQPACLSYELSLPNKLFEYVLAGVPVLAADLPVIGEFVREHEVGLVARGEDPGDVAAKLTQMLDPERNRALRAAAERAASELSWENESRVLESVYTEAAAMARPRS